MSRSRPGRVAHLEVDQQSMSVLHQGVPHEDEPGLLPFRFRINRASGIGGAPVRLFDRFTPWKSTDGLPGSLSVTCSGLPSGLEALQAGGPPRSAFVAVNCSSESRPRAWGPSDHFVEELLPDLRAEQGSRFL